MSAANPLDTLIELARQNRDNTGRALADEQRQSQQVAGQLDTLHDYRRQYAEQLQALLCNGTDTATLHNYQRFLRSLDSAIERARGTLEQQEERVANSREQWRQHQRQLTSYDTLASRRVEVERRDEQRRELRQHDEIAAGINARRRQQQPEQ